MNAIYETIVYDKKWKVWNISTGTVYSVEYDTDLEALGSIEHDQERNGSIVKRVFPEDILALLKANHENIEKLQKKIFFLYPVPDFQKWERVDPGDIIEEDVEEQWELVDYSYPDPQVVDTETKYK